MFSSYKEDDVMILLKNITGKVTPQSTEEREKCIQSGTHYCEMLPIEYEPSKEYMAAFKDALSRYKTKTALSVSVLAKRIYDTIGPNAVLVSLARAGTPIGILLKHYLEKNFHTKTSHYTISIIRGKGIDDNAMQLILRHHDPKNIVFIDGWTGKGAIAHQLRKAMQNYDNVKPTLAVLSDPAHIADLYGTHDDFLIPSCCLNATVSGLLSRTFLRDDIIKKDDFHGAIFYENLRDKDVTYRFINAIESAFVKPNMLPTDTCDDFTTNADVMREIQHIQDQFKIHDINLIKPSIGEATRVLLRRVPWKILVHSMDDTEHLGHLYQLAKEKNVPLEIYPLKYYKACGLIKSMGDV